MKKILPLMLAAVLTLSACGETVTEKAPEITPQPAASPEPTISCTPPPEKYDGLNSKGTGWGLVRKKGAPPEVEAKSEKLLEENNGFYIDKNAEKVMYLTFDEGYENGFTSKILDVLQSENVPAAFFVTGPYLKNQTELVKRMIDEGHIVGNHTVNHLNLPNQTAAKVQTELGELNKMCEEMYGVSMHYMRPPEGEYSEKVLAVAKDMGYKTILWSFAYKDWDVNIQKGKDYAISQVVPYFHNGAILLLHAVSSDNAAALEDIIRKAKEEGYEFKSLDCLSESNSVS